MWTLSLQTTVRDSCESLCFSYSSPVYPDNLFVTFPPRFSLPLHMCLSYTKFLLNFLNGIDSQRTVPHGPLSRRERLSGFTYKDGEEKCLSHSSTSSRQRMGESGHDYCTVNIQRQPPSSPAFSEDKIWENQDYRTATFQYLLRLVSVSLIILCCYQSILCTGCTVWAAPISAGLAVCMCFFSKLQTEENVQFVIFPFVWC